MSLCRPFCESMSAVFWKIHKFGVFEAKLTFKLFYDCFASSEFAFKIQANANQAAICLLFKSKVGLGSKPKSLWLFAVCVALAAALSVLLSRLIKVERKWFKGRKPLSGLRLQNPRIFKIQKKMSAAPHASPYFCLQQQKYAKMPPQKAQSLENLCRFANS